MSDNRFKEAGISSYSQMEFEQRAFKVQRSRQINFLEDYSSARQELIDLAESARYRLLTNEGSVEFVYFESAMAARDALLGDKYKDISVSIVRVTEFPDNK